MHNLNNSQRPLIPEGAGVNCFHWPRFDPVTFNTCFHTPRIEFPWPPGVVVVFSIVLPLSGDTQPLCSQEVVYGVRSGRLPLRLTFSQSASSFAFIPKKMPDRVVCHHDAGLLILLFFRPAPGYSNPLFFHYCRVDVVKPYKVNVHASFYCHFLCLLLPWLSCPAMPGPPVRVDACKLRC